MRPRCGSFGSSCASLLPLELSTAGCSGSEKRSGALLVCGIVYWEATSLPLTLAMPGTTTSPSMRLMLADECGAGSIEEEAVGSVMEELLVWGRSAMFVGKYAITRQKGPTRKRDGEAAHKEKGGGKKNRCAQREARARGEEGKQKAKQTTVKDNASAETTGDRHTHWSTMERQKICRQRERGREEGSYP